MFFMYNEFKNLQFLEEIYVLNLTYQEMWCGHNKVSFLSGHGDNGDLKELHNDANIVK